MREVCGETAADGIGDGDKHDRSCRHLAGKRSDHWRRLTEHHVGPQPGQLFGQPADPFVIRARPAKLDAHIAAFYPAKLRQCTPERRDHGLRNRIIVRKSHQDADLAYFVGPLLRAHRKRPRRRHDAEQRDELAAPQLTELHETASSQ
jgi:hypothetical protein